MSPELIILNQLMNLGYNRGGFRFVPAPDLTDYYSLSIGNRPAYYVYMPVNFEQLLNAYACLKGRIDAEENPVMRVQDVPADFAK